MNFIEKLDSLFYPDFGRNWDDDIFRKVLLENIKESHAVLDFGAGRGALPQMNFKPHASFVAGVDPDPVVLTNPHLHEAKRLDLSSGVIPYEDDTFDIVFSDNVMEHVQDPEVVLKEIERVLKPGGKFFFKTPNEWHYMPLIARFTPLAFHKAYNRLRGREHFDTFKTHYSLNSKAKIKRLGSNIGFSDTQIDHIEGRPEYLRITSISYLLGILYERIVNSSSVFDRFRCVLIAELSKSSSQANPE